MTVKPLHGSRLEWAVWEADRHVDALTEALAEWPTVDLVDATVMDRDPHLRRLIDQIIYRFTKLQDTIGERLIAATLDVLNEPFEDWPMRDRLHRLEKLGFLNVEAWLTWRELRNRLSHEYPEQAALRLATIQATVAACTDLMSCYQRWREKLR